MADEFSEEFTNEDLRDLHRLVQQAALHSYPNPERTGCPGLRVLEEVANTRAPFQHPAYNHIKTCSPCLTEMLELRRKRIRAQKPEKIEAGSAVVSRRTKSPSFFLRFWRRPIWAWIAVAAALVFAASLMLRTLVHSGPENNSNQVALVDRTINLWDRDTLRGVGEPAPLQAVVLPATFVRVKIILPRFSEGGNYSIAVTSDNHGGNVLARGVAPAKADGPREVVTVSLDLRGKTPGSYFLQTTRDQDEASYFYPLKVL